MLWATWVIGSEAIEPSNWLFCFGCASEELRVVVANPAEWMANYPTPPSPWDAYHALMKCRLVALDECPGVRPVGIRETLHQYITKLVMQAEGDQMKTTCESLQLCSGLEDGIEGATHAIAKRRRERTALTP